MDTKDNISIYMVVNSIEYGNGDEENSIYAISMNADETINYAINLIRSIVEDESYIEEKDDGSIVLHKGEDFIRILDKRYKHSFGNIIPIKHEILLQIGLEDPTEVDGDHHFVTVMKFPANGTFLPIFIIDHSDEENDKED